MEQGFEKKQRLKQTGDRVSKELMKNYLVQKSSKHTE